MSATKISKAEIAKAVKAGQTPVEFLLSVMNNQNVDMGKRIDAAKSAAPYVHPKLSAIDHNADVSLSHEDALRELE